MGNRFVVIDQQRLDNLSVSTLHDLDAADFLNWLSIRAKVSWSHCFIGDFLIFAKIGVKDLFVMTLIVVNLFVNLLSMLGLSKKTFLYCGDRRSEEDSCEANQGKWSCDNYWTMLNTFIDTKNKTEGDCTSDDTCVRDENEISEPDARFIAEELKDLDDTNCTYETAWYTDDKHGDEELPRPVKRDVREEGNTKVTENKGFHSIGHHLEGNWGHLLCLWRKIVPAVFGHNDTSHKQSDDTRVMEELSHTISHVPEHENEIYLNYWVHSEESEFLENIGTNDTENHTNEDWEETEFDETVNHLERSRWSEFRVRSCILIHCVEQDDTHCIVCDTLAKDKWE